MADKLIPARPRSNADIEAEAMRIIRRYQPEVLGGKKPFDIELFFDCDLEDLTDIGTGYRDLEAGIYGYTDTERMECVISTDLMDNKCQERFRRSTMAHEVGHVVLHVDDYRVQRATLRSVHGNDHLRAYRAEQIVLYKNPEWQAWRFASAILMPEMPFREVVSEGCDEWELANLFNINPAFVRTRAKFLKINL